MCCSKELVKSGSKPCGFHLCDISLPPLPRLSFLCQDRPSGLITWTIALFCGCWACLQKHRSDHRLPVLKGSEFPWACQKSSLRLGWPSRSPQCHRLTIKRMVRYTLTHHPATPWTFNPLLISKMFCVNLKLTFLPLLPVPPSSRPRPASLWSISLIPVGVSLGLVTLVTCQALCKSISTHCLVSSSGLPCGREPLLILFQGWENRSTGERHSGHHRR